MPRITVTSVFVDEQDKALSFYTDTLGFQPKANIPLGDHSWITVVSPDAPEGTELLLEPDQHPAAQAYKQALVADGIPATMFEVDDLAAEHRRLSELGVRFTTEPTEMGNVTIAVLDDTCGNLIQLVQVN